jgi:Zn-dependent M28 family amino/carboxypeptidase
MIVSGGGFPPKEAGGTFPLPGKQGEDWEHPYSYALNHGAKGIVFIPGYPTLTRWDYEFNRQTEGIISVEKFQAAEPVRVVYESPLNPRAAIGLPINKDVVLPVITASAQMTTALLEGERQYASAVFQKMTTGTAIPAFYLNQNKRLNLTVRVRRETEQTQNVVGVVEGSDPVLKNEYVAIGAHYDHLGIGAGTSGDTIYNGADDDGSGTVALLAMAQALMQSRVRPRRSVLFVWHAGEEEGLWGSRYFTDSPTVPLENIIAQLNVDMIGRSKPAADTKEANRELSGTDEIYVIGSKLMSSELGELSERVNRDYLNFKFNYKYDDPEDPNRFFYRSDHYNYARKGIPVIFYFNGSHED